jgi:hypothetical protein
MQPKVDVVLLTYAFRVHEAKDLEVALCASPCACSICYNIDEVANYTCRAVLLVAFCV